MESLIQLEARMAAPDQPPPPDATEAAFDSARSRSPLQDWMRKHQVMLARRLKERRLLWSEIARVLAEQGVRDAKGNPPTAAAARQAWMRLNKGRPSRSKRPVQKPAIEPTGQPAAPAAPVPASAAAGSLPQAPAAPAPAPVRKPFDPTEGAFDPKPQPRFKPASLK